MLSLERDLSGNIADALPGACGDYAGVATAVGSGSQIAYPPTSGDTPANGAFVNANLPKPPALNEFDDLPAGTTVIPTGWTGYVKFASVSDGLSNTFFIGEKYVHPDQFGLEEQPATGSTATSRYRGDGPFYSATNYHNAQRTGGGGFARFPTQYPTGNNLRFGSNHEGVINFVFGDGSVRPVPVTISLDLILRLCNIKDGEVVDLNF